MVTTAARSVPPYPWLVRHQNCFKKVKIQKKFAICRFSRSAPFSSLGPPTAWLGPDRLRDAFCSRSIMPPRWHPSPGRTHYPPSQPRNRSALTLGPRRSDRSRGPRGAARPLLSPAACRKASRVQFPGRFKGCNYLCPPPCPTTPWCVYHKSLVISQEERRLLRLWIHQYISLESVCSKYAGQVQMRPTVQSVVGASKTIRSSVPFALRSPAPC